ncbi:MAG TPA: [FeFe] hydrogenase H-cluster maturation GTPase HydF [Treponemataceae bacterium]|nr:[FeFe] hydrogenase H-cluster maturation GTPase HydF [Treponemataceae bacterium]
MTQTPKALRLHIGIFGRTNTGKSSFLNLITGQETAIVSPVAGTTTDVVQKSMELLPIGPVTFLDTAGINDTSELGAQRVKKTLLALNSCDVALLMLECGIWTDAEEELVNTCANQKTPLILIINKSDLSPPSSVKFQDFKNKIKTLHREHPVMEISCTEAHNNWEERERVISTFKKLLLRVAPESLLGPAGILGDLLPKIGLPLVVLIVPIDIEAPKGRLILPQVQTIRDALDSRAAVVVVKETDYPDLLTKLISPPDLVICDSQVAGLMVKNTPEGIPCTTFSILFSRFKGDIVTLAKGAARLAMLKKGDRVLIAEACTHHAVEDDIGRVKIPRWIQEYIGFDLNIDHCAGKDYPENIADYTLIIHCGACTLTRREMLWRIDQTLRAKMPDITNYGIAISVLQGVIERTLSPFPQALIAYKDATIAYKAATKANTSATQKAATRECEKAT